MTIYRGAQVRFTFDMEDQTTASGLRLRVRRRTPGASEVEVTLTISGSSASGLYLPPASGTYDWRVWRGTNILAALEGTFQVQESRFAADPS